jgi:hypothetical protein
MILRAVQGSCFGIILLAVVGNSVECSYRALKKVCGHTDQYVHREVIMRTYAIKDFNPTFPLSFKGVDVEDGSEVSFFHLFKRCKISWEVGDTVRLRTQYVDDFNGRLVPILSEPLKDMCGS